MFFRKLFPYALAACFLTGIVSLSVSAQSRERGFRQVIEVAEANEELCSPDDPAIISVVSVEDIRAPKPNSVSSVFRADKFQQLMTAAIDERLGSRYRWGAAGPHAFDCSGFVWSIFQSAGITFERGSARKLWDLFEAPSPEDKFKFGTLVFFSGLAHVGVVDDERGFYHASRHHGVVYSPFNDYWVSRIDGFRRVPVPVTRATD